MLTLRLSDQDGDILLSVTACVVVDELEVGRPLARLDARGGQIDRGVSDRNTERRWLPRRVLAHVE
jgi:hypothetical protein